MNKTGLYLHIPFCRSKCRYCDFYSLPDPSRMGAYVQALVRELRQRSGELGDRTIDSIYVGGGTPTALSSEALGKICRAVSESYLLTDDCEWTVEANPATVNREKLTVLRQSGVNRLSMGLQSIHSEELRYLGRIHDYTVFADNFALARECGFVNISVDLMLGIPVQSVTSLRESIDRVAALSPEHLSLYGLRIEEETPFFAERERLPLPDEDSEREMYLSSVEQLALLGYRQYEISNFAREGYASRHNLRYWRREDYLGFGPAAHSFLCGVRFFNLPDIAGYIASPVRSLAERMAEGERVSPKDALTEVIMLGLRLREGIPFALLRELPGYPSLEGKIALWEREGLCRFSKDGGRFSFTPSGMLVSNTLISEIFLAMDEKP